MRRRWAPRAPSCWPAPPSSWTPPTSNWTARPPRFIAGVTAIEQSLTAIAGTGTLGIADGRAFVTTQTLTDSGLIQLDQGTLVAASLTIATGGMLSGDGSVSDPVNNGTIAASSGTLLISSAVSGTGVLQVDSRGGAGTRRRRRQWPDRRSAILRVAAARSSYCLRRHAGRICRAATRCISTAPPRSASPSPARRCRSR